MKEQVKNVFSQVTMPEKTQQTIRRAMAQRKTGGSSWKAAVKILVAAAAMVLLVFTISPTARAAVKQWTVKYFFPGSDITVYEETDENGNTVGIAAVNTEAPGFARIVNGRLYFVGNGEKIDITDQIEEDAPYYYEYVDDYGLTHMMAVGYSGSMENFGIYEFIKDEQAEKWVTGTGRNNLNPETEARYPWVDIIWDHWDIPWPMPE